MENFKKHLELENGLIAITEQAIEDVVSIGRIQYDNIAIQYFLFLKFALEFFVRRAKFIIKIISDDKFSENEKGILKNLFRGFIEIITRVEYAKKEKKAFIVNYLWDQLKVGLRIMFLEISSTGKLESKEFLIALNFYRELQKIYQNIPEFEKMIKDYCELENSLLNPSKNALEFLKNNKKLEFPLTKNLINNYWVDQKPINKIEAYGWYRIFSSQIHAALLFEGHEAKTIHFQILSFLMMFHFKFLNPLTPELKVETRDRINKAIEEIKRNNPNFVSSWKTQRSFLV